MNLHERADESYFQAWRTFGRNSRGFVVESDGLLSVATGVEVAFLNIAFVTRPLVSPNEQIARAAELFDQRSLPFIVRIREGFDSASEIACDQLGIRYSDTVPGMASTQMSAPPDPAGLEIRIVRSAAERADLCAVLSAGFGLPVEFAEQLITPSLLRDPESESYVGYVDGEPVASSTLCFGGRTAGIHNVATVPGARRKGFGEAMTWHCITRGSAYSCNAAALQASEMGAPIYERMGFRTVSPYRTFHREGV